MATVTSYTTVAIDTRLATLVESGRVEAGHLILELRGGSDIDVGVVGSEEAGPSGPAIEMRTNSTHIQWRVVGDTTWIDLIALSELEGPPLDIESVADGAIPQSKVNGLTAALATITPIVFLSQAEYDLLSPPDADTLYIIDES